MQGLEPDVVGVNQSYDEPLNPSLKLENNTLEQSRNNIELILNGIKELLLKD